MARRKFEVGQRVWLMDYNHRVYGPDRGAPLYSGYYLEYRVTGVEKRSYLIARSWDQGGLSRPDLYGFARAEGLFLTDQEKDDDVYREAHRHHLSEMVRKADAATLRQVAEILEGPPLRGET